MSTDPLYDPLPTPADCNVVTIKAALAQIGEEAKHVSSDVWVSNLWTEEDRRQLRDALWASNSLANRVRVDNRLREFEWYVECCGTYVGSNPPG